MRGWLRGLLLQRFITHFRLILCGVGCFLEMADDLIGSSRPAFTDPEPTLFVGRRFPNSYAGYAPALHTGCFPGEILRPNREEQIATGAVTPRYKKICNHSSGPPLLCGQAVRPSFLR